jgi:hypothetical protein
MNERANARARPSRRSNGSGEDPAGSLRGGYVDTKHGGSMRRVHQGEPT